MTEVKKQVHEPGGQEGQPPDDDHHPDLVLGHNMRETIDVNKYHVGGHHFQGGNCQPVDNGCRIPLQNEPWPQNNEYDKGVTLMESNNLVYCIQFIQRTFL